jgi:hypothetical protein
VELSDQSERLDKPGGAENGDANVNEEVSRCDRRPQKTPIERLCQEKHRGCRGYGQPELEQPLAFHAAILSAIKLIV